MCYVRNVHFVATPNNEGCQLKLHIKLILILYTTTLQQ